MERGDGGRVYASRNIDRTRMFYYCFFFVRRDVKKAWKVIEFFLLMQNLDTYISVKIAMSLIDYVQYNMYTHTFRTPASIRP